MHFIEFRLVLFHRCLPSVRENNVSVVRHALHEIFYLLLDHRRQLS